MANENSIEFAVTVKIGERRVKIVDSGPFVLSGDPRRHRKQLLDHAEKTVAQILSALGARFQELKDG